jgi:hypothetical protein
VAFEEAVEGSARAAGAMLARVPADAALAVPLAGITRLVLELRAARRPQRAALLAEARPKLRELVPGGAPLLGLSPLGDAHHRASRRMWRDAGYPLAAIFWLYPVWLLGGVLLAGLNVMALGLPDFPAFPIGTAFVLAALLGLRRLLARV